MYAETIVDKHIECAWCNKLYTTPRDLYRYKDKYFCDSTCLGEYLIEQEGDEVEVIWFDTPENIEMREMERKAEY